jgi:lipid-binding SYLF domain-containing protein
MKNLLRLTSVITVGLFVLWSGSLKAKPTDEIQRIQDSLGVLHDLTGSPDHSIPRHLLERSEAIVVIPSLVKGGFVVGAKHGRGVMSARVDGKGFSAPAFVTMSGGSIGWQIGVESIDLVLLVMNRKGVDDLLSDNFTVGGNASVAAGPVGRNADAATDAKLSSEILAYSRSAGLFAGATFEGAAFHGDKDANTSFYGHPMTVRAIIEMTKPAGPEELSTWQQTLNELAVPKAPGRSAAVR